MASSRGPDQNSGLEVKARRSKQRPVHITKQGQRQKFGPGGCSDREALTSLSKCMCNLQLNNALEMGNIWHVPLVSACASSALTLLVGQQEGYSACKKYGGMVEVGAG